jgi:transcriptional regulator CtsR
MVRISDNIEGFLKKLLHESEEMSIEIQRNELAKFFACSPSQINYVLMTRFSLQQGYTIESQRGGGGYIKITRLLMDKQNFIQHIINEELRTYLSRAEAVRTIRTLAEYKLISVREAMIMQAAIDDAALTAPIILKNQIRTNILKNMLVALLSREE